MKMSLHVLTSIVVFLVCFTVAVKGINCSANQTLAHNRSIRNPVVCEVNAKNLTARTASLYIKIDNKCSEEPYNVTYYNVTYYYVTDAYEKVGANELVEEEHHELMDLEPNVEYNVCVCTKIKKSIAVGRITCTECCSTTFNTSIDIDYGNFTTIPLTQNASNSSSALPELRINVFAPFLNHDAISAQIVWDDPVYNMNRTTFYPSYNIAVVDYKEGVQVFNHRVHRPFVNVNTYATTDPKLAHPLKRNKNYSVQVTSSVDHSTSYKSSFVADEHQNGLEYIILHHNNLYHYYNGYQLSSTQDFVISPLIALDKLHRVVYYYDYDNNFIYHASLDFPSQKKLLCSYTDGGNFEVIAMTFDWISRKLYMFMGQANQQFKLMYLAVVDDHCSIEHYGDMNIGREIYKMNAAINPISGLIYWTEYSTIPSRPPSLWYLNLSSPDPVMITDDLDSLALGLDVWSDCVYVVKSCVSNERTCKSVHTFGLCDFGKPIDIYHGSVNFIAVSETGIFVESTSSNTSFVTHFNHSGDFVKEFTQILPSAPTNSNNGNFLTNGWFDITSPGTQPLPELPCLNPRIAEPANIRITIQNQSYVIDWNPNLDHHPDCVTRPFSLPPVTYLVTLSLNNGTMKKYPTDLPRLRVSLNLMFHNVSVQVVVTRFPSNDSVLYLQDAHSQSTAMASPSQSPVGEIANTSSYMAIIGGIAGGVAFIILILVITIVILSLVLCAKSKKSSYVTNNNTMNYVPSSNGTTTTHTSPRYTENPNSVPAQSSSNPPQYESLSNHPLLSTSLQSSSNSHQSNGQYALPVDSIEQYRSNHHHTPVGQGLTAPYAVPADTLQQYRNSQLVGSPEKRSIPTSPLPIPVKDYPLSEPNASQGQEYEVPVSLSQHSDHLTLPTTSPDSNLYSTVDDANQQKQTFQISGRGHNPRPMSHVPPSEITEASQLYSEPVTSPKKSSKGGMPPTDSRFRSATLPHNRPGQAIPMVTKPFDNPVYDLSQGEPNSHAYSVVDRKFDKKPAKSQSSSNYSKLKHKENAHSKSDTSKSSEPTYFELVETEFKPKNSNPDLAQPTSNGRRDGESSSDYHHLDRSAITRTRSNPPVPSSYHQLEKCGLGTTTGLLDSRTNSKTKTLDNHSEPTYQVLEKPDRNATTHGQKHIPDSQTSNPEPAYSVLENRNTQNKPEPTYFEVERDPITSDDKEQPPLYFQLEQEVSTLN